MKKFLLTLVCVLLAVAVNAADPVVFDFTPTTNPTSIGTSANTSEATTTLTASDGTEYSVKYLQLNWQKYSSSSAVNAIVFKKSVDGYMTFDLTGKTAVSKVRIYLPNASSAPGPANNKADLVIDGTTVGSFSFTGSAKGVWSNAIEIPAAQQGKAITIAHLKSNPKTTAVGKIEFTLADGNNKEDAKLSFNPNTYTVKIGQTVFEDEPTFVNPFNVEGITFKSGNEEVAKVDEATGKITEILSEGEAVITATVPADNKDYYGEGFYTLTVKGKTPAGITYGDNNEVNVLTTELASFKSPVITNPNNLTVSYVSGNTAVATVATDGVITLTGAVGTAVITATTDETADYAAGEAKYTINVIDPASIPDSYTVSFDFNQATIDGEANPNFISNLNSQYTAPTSEGVELEYPISNKDVTISFAKGPSATVMSKWWKAREGLECRFYANNTLTITAPKGHRIVEFKFTQGAGTDKTAPFTVKSDDKDAGTYDSKTLTWTAGTGNYNTVVFSGKTYFTLLEVTVEKVSEAPDAPSATTEEGAAAGQIDLSDYTTGVDITLTVADGCTLWYKFEATSGSNKVIADPEAEHFIKAEGTSVVVPVSEAGTLSYFAEKDGQQSDLKFITFTGATTAITEIEAAEGEAEYYDLMGRKVANPAKGGFYIRVQGGKAVKVAL